MAVGRWYGLAARWSTGAGTGARLTSGVNEGEHLLDIDSRLDRLDHWEVVGVTEAIGRADALELVPEPLRTAEDGLVAAE